MKPQLTSLHTLIATLVIGLLPVAGRAVEPLPEGVEVIKVQAPVVVTDSADPITRNKSFSIHVLDALAKEREGQERTWLGVALAEPDETLVAQLALKDGVGLVVTHVAKDSPAEKAGLQKNDVLLEFNGQNLVVPQQLQKLVQARKEGEKVTLKLLRGGKRDSLSVTLGKTKLAAQAVDGGDTLIWRSDAQGRSLYGLNDALKQSVGGDTLGVLRKTLDDAKVDQQQVQVEIRRSVDLARKAMEDALRQAQTTSADAVSQAQKRQLEALAKAGVFVPETANVTIRTTEKASKSLVRTDDSGTIVLVKNPRLRLTVHDQAGKLQFDGEVETPEQKAEIPAELLKKVEPILEQFTSGAAE